jgi:DNA primase catalytic core
MLHPNGHADSHRKEIDAIKAAIDLPAFIEEHGVPLKKTGDNWQGSCPFHDHDDNPSFTVNPRRQLFHCFSCEKAGDVYNFLKLKEGMEFPQALAYLRSRFGIIETEPSTPPPERRALIEQPDHLPGGYTRPQLLARVAELYRHGLAESKAARQYLRSRGLDVPELIEAFSIGFCDGKALLNTLPAEGELRQALVSLGVITEKGRELFSGCIVIPLEHPDQGIVGFYGRKISPQAEMRHLYLRGPQRGVLNWPALNASATIYVAESVIDALSLWSAGVRDVTAIYGIKGMHRDLEELLGRFSTQEVRLCLDADAAGQEATIKVATRLAERGIRAMRVKLPEGSDPNTVLVAQGGASLRALAGQAERVELPVEAMPPAAPNVEQTASGFVVHFGELAYHVTPQGPFSGKLRAIVKPTLGDKKLSDNGDLYTHRVRMNIAAQVQRHFEVPKAEAERHMLGVLQAAEAWLESQQQARQDASEKLGQAPPMADAERDEALAFLRRPDLVEAILEDLEAMGYAGEDHGKLLAYMVGVSRKLDAPLSAIIRSQSSAGKSAMAELIENLTPSEDVVAFARLSAQALLFEKKDFLKHKLLILEERVGAEQADYSIRVLISKHRATQAVVVKDVETGQMRTQHYEVEGPIAYVETTTSSHINYENRTRCFEIHLDESEEQTKRIHQQQRRSQMQGWSMHSRDSICRRHHNAQRLLEPLKVYTPYAELMDFPTRWLRTRRDNQRFLSLIRASAFLHQHQREGGSEHEDGKERAFINANLDDYRLAYRLAKEVLDISLQELSRDASSLCDAAQAMVAARSEAGESVYFTRKELRAFTDWQDHRMREALNELVEMEYLDKLGGSQGKTILYRLNDEPTAGPGRLHQLTTPEQLEVRMRHAGLLV